MPGQAPEVVMAVFSGTGVDRVIFDRALDLAKQHGARLVLADVRHQHHAEKLAESLSSQAFLGPAAVEELKRSVKAQRDDLIQRALASMREAATAAGVTAEIRQAKGALGETVRALATDVGATTVVIEEQHVGDVAGNYKLVGASTR